MTWKPAGRESGARLIAWLKTDEWKHTSLCARIKDSGGNPILGRIADGRLWIRKAGHEIMGLLFISRYGAVLPAYDAAGCDDEEEAFLTKLISSQREKLFSIIGMENRVRDVESRLTDSPRDSQSYRMLTLEQSPPAAEIGAGIMIRRAEESDFAALWPLEKNYQIEEVLRKGGGLDERFAKRRFMDTLKDHVVYGLWKNGKAVAKAQTNARGWTFEQIGGVYVDREHRKKGCGRAVVGALIRDIRKRNAGACLFVKIDNIPALRLYENLGFDDKGSFRIVYY